MIDKDKIKNSLSIEQVFNLVAEFGGEPTMRQGYFISATICHNHPGEGSHKLYYYENTKLFRCYTECNDTFDIFELVTKIKNQQGAVKEYYTEDGQTLTREWTLPDSVKFVANYFNLINFANDFFDSQLNLHDWEILNKYEENNLKNQDKIAELHIFDDKILAHLPQPRFVDWENEGISRDICKSRKIYYDPRTHGIVIPHYDINNNLIGIRERTLVKEYEKYGKYRPAILNGVMYNHPLGFNLYNINNSKDNIKSLHTAIVFEGEKSCLKYASYFGIDNDISVAVCGSALIDYQVNLLIAAGAKEIVIAFDKQYQETGDKEWKGLVEKYYSFKNKYGNLINISFIWDKENILNYKDSPIDQGKNNFIKLFINRIFV